MKRVALLLLLTLSLTASPLMGQGVLEKMQSDIAGNTTSIDKAKADLVLAQAALKAAQADITASKAEIAALKLRVEALEKPVPPPPPPPPPGTRTTLTAADFTLLGNYEINPQCGMYAIPGRSGGELNYGMGFTHRYVNGKLRFLTYGYLGGDFHLVEFEAPANLGGQVTTATNVWTKFASIGWWNGIWWDEENKRLFKVQGVDYPDASNENNRMAISTVKLNDDGTVTGKRGMWGLNGIPDRRIMGGVCKVPQWFQTQYATGKYGVGFGGYASRMATNTASMGLSLYAIGDPETTADNQLLPSYKTLSDHSSGTTEKDWYANGKPTLFDRGARQLAVNNTYDNGNWKTPSPDGLGRWAWGDTAANTGAWIDNDDGTRAKHGFVIVPNLVTGRAWYETSSLNSEGKGSEIQVFDPAHLGKVSKGEMQPWAVQPVAIKNITVDTVGHTAPTWGHPRPGGVEGASFDPLTNRLYVYCTSATAPKLWSHIYVYQVAN